MPRRQFTIPALTLLALCPLRAQAQPAPNREETTAFKDFIQLMDTPVVSVSNVQEKRSEAPATIIVLENEDLEKRGYTMLSQILDDLPGMQVSRAYGDMQVKNYWRGYRNFIGDPYLLLVDGLTQSHLWYSGVETPLTALPLSHIDRIEVVYGPASAVYGANAFMGVINVITQKDRDVDGSFAKARLGGASSTGRTLDANYLFKAGPLRFSFTARIDNHLDGVKNEAYEYTKNRYFADRRLWGGFADDPVFGGQYRSESQSRALDTRLFMGNTEFGFQYILLKTGTGSEYAADRVQNAEKWQRRELSLHLRHSQAISDRLGSVTTIRYRESGNPRESAFLDGYESGSGYVVAYSLWQTQNSSVAVLQDFDWKASNTFALNFGINYEQKDLQKKYDNNYGLYVPAASLTLDNYPFPEPISDSLLTQNRITTEDRGFYLQTRWKVGEGSILILGGRADYNSQYKGAKTIRLGYVGNYGPWSLKALYGEGVQEPAQRILYGTWRAGQGNPNLDRERSRTVEISGGYTRVESSLLLSIWEAQNEGIAIPTSPDAMNLGETKVAGADLQVQHFVNPLWLRRWKIWANASYLFRFDGSNRADTLGVVPKEGLTPSGQVGDLARIQFQFGTTLDLHIPLSLTMLARYVGARSTVATNPIPRVGGFTVVDWVATTRRLAGVRGLGLTFKVSNLTDRTYFHPGLSQANAGNTPGAFDASGLWHGSEGYYSSLLPQPGRTFQLTLGLQF